MRDHLAALLDDFRSYGREVAVVRYKGCLLYTSRCV